MNIVIFSPAIKASAIGRMTRLVALALLERGHHISVVRSEAEGSFTRETHDFGVALISWKHDVDVLSVTSSADLIVYQIGDNFDFHQGCVHWLPRIPGVVCLHDFFVGHLFYAWKHQPNNDSRAAQTLKRWYGAEVADGYFCHPDSGAFISATSEAAPMTEWIASQALGVITHSEWGVGRVRSACIGPVRIVPLAYDAPGAADSSARYAPPLFGQFNLLTIGYVNRNKRVEQVMEAIAASALLRQNVVYRLVGYVEAGEALRLTALANGLKVRLLMSGEVGEAALAHAVQEADAISCLRWPSLEAASASAIEAMLYGKAAIVTNTGFYRDLPDDCVEKISLSNEVDSIRQALERFYHAPDLRKRIGVRARKFASQTYSADGYAQALIEMSAPAQKTRPLFNARTHFDGVLTRWGASGDLLGDAALQEALSIIG